MKTLSKITNGDLSWLEGKHCCWQRMLGWIGHYYNSYTSSYSHLFPPASAGLAIVIDNWDN